VTTATKTTWMRREIAGGAGTCRRCQRELAQVSRFFYESQGGQRICPLCYWRRKESTTPQR